MTQTSYHSPSSEHRLLEATAKAANALLTVAPFDAAVNTALQILGESLETDRINIHENLGEPSDSSLLYYQVLYEWDSPGTVPQFSDPAAAGGTYAEIQWLYDLFQQGQTASYRIEDAPEPFHSEQTAIGVKATHLVPIQVKGKWWGVLGIDDCREAKRRSAAELSVLTIAADCIGSAIQRDRTQQALLQAEQERVADLTEANEKLRQRDHFLETTATVANTLLTIAPFDAAVNTALKILGESLDTDRFIVTENFNPSSDSSYPSWRALGYEWTSPGTMPQYGDLEASQGSYEDIPEIFEPLSQGRTISFLIEETSEPFRSTQMAIGVKATHGVPIFVEGQWWGNVGFDDCQEAKQRSAAELSVLKIAADCIGSAIERDRTQQALLQAEQERSQALERHNTELQQTLDRLTESEQRYRQLMELASEGIFRVEYEEPISVSLPVEEQAKQIYQQFRYAEHNLAFAQMYGYDQANVLTGTSLAHVMDAPENALQMEQFVRNGHEMRNQETVEIDRNGRRRHFLNNGFSIIRDGYAIGGWGTQIDITELRETQQALLQAEQARSQALKRHNAELQETLDRLAESEQRYRTLFELSNEGIYRFEFEQPISTSLPTEKQLDLTLQHYRYVEANGTFCAQMGLSIDQLRDFTIGNFHGDLEANRQVNRSILANGYRIRNAETDELDAVGKRKYFLNNVVCDVRDGYLWGGWCTQTDITELRETQQALLKAEQERSQALERHNTELQQANATIIDRERETAQLLDITRAIAQIQDSTTLLQTIYRDIQPIFGFDNATIVLLEENQQSFRVLHHELSAGRSEFAAFFSQPIPLAGTPLEKGFFQRPSVHIVNIEEWLQDYPDYPGLQIAQQSGLREIFVSKLYSGGKFLGEIELVYKNPPVFDEAFHKLFENFANQVAVAVANILAKEQIVEREREKAILLEITQAIAQINDTQTLFEVIYSQIQPIFRFDAATVVVLEDDATAYRVLYHENGSSFDQFFAEPIQLAGSPFEEAFSPAIADIYPADVDKWLARYPHYEGLRLTKQAGYQQILLGKLYNGGKLLGVVELLYQHPPVLDEAFRNLFENFVQQVAIAVANILAHQKIITQQAALLRAEQERVAELAKTNAALKNSLDRLAANPDLNAFLGHVLLEIVQQFQVELGYLWLYDAESQTLPLHLYIKQGQIYPQPELELPTSMLNPTAVDQPIWETLLHTRQPFVITHENAADYVIRDTYVWQKQQQSSQGGINLLLTLKDEPIGLLALVSTRRSFSPEELELAQALAHQATLALQLTRLAEAAKQAAIAREQEQAAQERAAELERANNALQSTVAALADRRDLNGFIGEVLHTIAREFESPLVEYWTALGSDTVEVNTWLYDNQLCSLKQNDEHPSRGGIRLLPEYVGSEDFTHRSQLFVLDEPIPAYSLALGEVICPTEWYAERGVIRHFNFPLQVGNATVGAISVWLPSDRQVTEACLRLGQSLSHQTALAIQLTQLADEAKLAAIAREQEKAAQERAAELAKANEALQATIDAMAAVEDLDEFVPAVLQIVGQTFETENCSFYEHYDNEPIYLRYWRMGDYIFHPDELLNLDGDRFAVVRQLAGGFTVSDAHLGTPVRERTKAVILDHATGTSVSEFDVFCCENGWEVELNVPLVVDGCANGALLIYRPAGATFTSSEIELAETLGKQLALAMQASRLATEGKSRAVEAAIAREQEKAAQERAAELERANNALQSTVAALADRRDLDGFIGEVLHTIAREFESPLVEYWTFLGADTAEVHTWLYDHQLFSLKQNDEHPSLGGIRLLPEFVNFEDLTQSDQVLVFEAPIPAYSLALGAVICPTQWYAERGASKHFNFRLQVGRSNIGSIGVWLPPGQQLSDDKLRLGQTLSHQTALAIQLTRLAEEAKQAAILDERNRMARDIHDTLAQAFGGILMQLQASDRFFSSNPVKAHHHQTIAHQLAQDGLDEARRTVWLLYQDDLEYSDLATLIPKIVSHLLANAEIEVDVAITGTPSEVEPTIGMNLLRIVQESINNALRHADAHTLRVHLTYTPQHLRLCIRDDGCGFDPEQQFQGFGLTGMQQRAKAIAAQFHLNSHPDTGTEICIILPFPVS